MLIQGLPYDGVFMATYRADQEKALKPTVEQIRSRAEHYRKRREEAS